MTNDERKWLRRLRFGEIEKKVNYEDLNYLDIF